MANLKQLLQTFLANVKEKGDEALFSYTKEFDKVEVTADTIRVTEAEIQEAYEAVDAPYWKSSARLL